MQNQNNAITEIVQRTKKPMDLSNSQLPVLQDITYSELIQTVVSNKGSQCSSADIVEELKALIKIRTQEAINLTNNTMKYLIDEVRLYE